MLLPFIVPFLVVCSFILIVGYIVPSFKLQQNKGSNSKFQTTSKDEYNVSFRVSYQLFDGEYVETKLIDVSIIAESSMQAKELVKEKALEKIQLTIVSVTKIK